MAPAIGNFIDRIQIGNDDTNQIAIGSSAYGVCSTIASEAAKTATIPGFVLNPGTTIHIKFTNSNSASTPTLNISNTGAKSIMQYGTTNADINDETTGWQAGAVLTLTYDGTSWIRDQGYNTNVNNKVTQIGNAENKEFSILLKNTDNTTDETSEIKYSNATNKLITINPSIGRITAPGGIVTGNTNTYGDAYTPIYWNDGVPAIISPIQYVDFEIESGNIGVLLTHTAFALNSYVLQIVVTSGAEYLTSAISWENYIVNDTSNTIQLSCSATSGAVSGYIVVARGTSLSSVTSTQIEQSQSQSEPEPEEP